MDNLTKCEFVPLHLSGRNYTSWALDAKMHLTAKGLGDTIKENNQADEQANSKAIIFLRHHLHENLQFQYLTDENPLDLWKALKERFDHLKMVVLPKARSDWHHLRLQDYKTVTEYDSAMHRIASQLKLCGEPRSESDMLEKTFSTFHASNMILQQQYREKGFTNYSALISHLLVAEQQNELLLKNHETRPTGTSPFPEANATNYHNHRGRGRGRGRHNGRGRGRGRGRNEHHSASINKGTDPHKPEASKEKSSNSTRNICFRCGSKGHWSRVCRTPKHLVDLYQSSLKKGIETNFINSEGDTDGSIDPEDYDGPVDISHLDVSDFYAHPEGKIDHLVGDIVGDENTQFE